MKSFFFLKAEEPLKPFEEVEMGTKWNNCVEDLGVEKWKLEYESSSSESLSYEPSSESLFRTKQDLIRVCFHLFFAQLLEGRRWHLQVPLLQSTWCDHPALLLGSSECSKRQGELLPALPEHFHSSWAMGSAGEASFHPAMMCCMTATYQIWCVESFWLCALLVTTENANLNVVSYVGNVWIVMWWNLHTES